MKRIVSDMAFVTLATKFPCCGAKARIRATNDVPRETYTKKCKCGCKWEVERRTVKQGSDKRIVVLNWTLSKSECVYPKHGSRS